MYLQTPASIQDIASYLLASKKLTLSTCTSLQHLWAGYGRICHVVAIENTADNPGICSLDSRRYSLILKYISPPSGVQANHVDVPDEGHIRKILSYQIEQYFYTELAPQMPEDVAVASCIASTISASGGINTTAMMMTDLREAFPFPGETRGRLNRVQVHSTLRWLGTFHGFWWTRSEDLSHSAPVLPPLEHYELHQSTTLLGKGGVWLNGGYTYLATRRKEYAELRDDSEHEWSSALCQPLVGEKSIAELAAAFLSSPTSSSQPHRTLIHGNIKNENLFSTKSGDAVAFYDFQYVGLGLGVCDLAKLFTCSVPLDMLVGDSGHVNRITELKMMQGEKDLLRAYTSQLQKTAGKQYDWETLVRHWETALVDWLRFQASWGFWGNSEWLEARVRSILKDESWLEWLEDAVGSE